jgi:Asparagine synthase
MIERYWRLQVPGVDGAPERLDLGLDEAASEVRRLLSEAIRRRLISDAPLGAFLSGGIDSSAIVVLMAGLVGEPVKTFTMGFEDRDGFDERPFAQAVARRFATEHHAEVVNPTRSSWSSAWCGITISRSATRAPCRPSSSTRWHGGTSQSRCQVTGATSCSPAASTSQRAWRLIASWRCPARFVSLVAVCRRLCRRPP